MRYEELICRSAQELQAAQPGIGVRLSPVRLTPAEVAALAELAPTLLGGRVYVALACAGAVPQEGPRLCVSPGERAAERATEWRNQVDTSQQEWVLYISAERLGRAGGLHDTLRPLDEQLLKEHLLRWARDQAAALPTELVEALADPDVAARRSSRELCAYLGQVAAAPEAQRWDVAGKQLPTLGLATDSRLKDDPLARLRMNQEEVAAAQSADRRGRSRGSAGAQALRQALHGKERGNKGRVAALQEVDLGALAASTPAPRSRSGAQGRPPPQAVRGLQPSPVVPPVAHADPERPLPVPPAVVSAPPHPSLSGQAQTVVHQASLGLERQKREDILPSGSQRAPWELAGVPEGLQELLRASLESPGDPLVWTLPNAALRGLLGVTPRALPEPVRLPAPELPPPVESLLAAWRRARAALLRALGTVDAGVEALPALGLVPAAALRGELLAAAQQLVAAAARTLGAAAVAPAAQARLLARDTVVIRHGASGAALVVPGPLHPLLLALVIERRACWDAALSEAGPAVGALSWALRRPLPMPSRWPDPAGGVLHSSSPAGCMPTFETRPTSTGEGQLRDTTTRVFELLLRLTPHAQVAAQVELVGVSGSAALDGLLDATAACAKVGPPPGPITVSVDHVSASSDRVGAAIQEGRMTLLPREQGPAAASGLAPHLTLRVPPWKAAPRSEVAQPPGTTLRPNRARHPWGWSLAWPLPSGVEAIERARADALGERPEEALIHALAEPTEDTPPHPDSTTWVATLTPAPVAPRPGFHRILSEPIPGGHLQVTTRDLRAATRGLEVLLRGLEVHEPAHLKLDWLSGGLHNSGLLPLEGDPSRLLLVRALGARLGGGGVVAPIQREHWAPLLGLGEGRTPAAFAVGAARGRRVELVVGLSCSRPPGQGKLGEAELAQAIAHAVQVLRASADPDRPAGAAARELLTEALWGALGASGDEAAQLRTWLLGADRVEVGLQILVLTPPGWAGLRVRELAGAPVIEQALSVGLGV